MTPSQGRSCWSHSESFLELLWSKLVKLLQGECDSSFQSGTVGLSHWLRDCCTCCPMASEPRRTWGFSCLLLLGFQIVYFLLLTYKSIECWWC